MAAILIITSLVENKQLWMGVRGQSNPNHPLEDCSPEWHFGCTLMKTSEQLEPPSSQFLNPWLAEMVCDNVYLLF